MRFLVIYFTVGDKKFIELVFREIYIIIFEIVVLYSVKDKKSCHGNDGKQAALLCAAPLCHWAYWPCTRSVFFHFGKIHYCNWDMRWNICI